MREEIKQIIEDLGDTAKKGCEWCKDHKEYLKLGGAFAAGLTANVIFGKAMDHFVDPAKGYYKLATKKSCLHFEVGDIWKNGKPRKSSIVSGHVSAEEAVNVSKWVLEKAGYEIED